MGFGFPAELSERRAGLDTAMADVTSPVLRLEFLGPPHVSRDARPLHFRTRKTLALLAYLVTTATAQPRERLAALLWPDLDEDHARTMLRTTLQYLRRALDESVAVAALLLKAERDALGRESLQWLPQLNTRVICDLDVVVYAAQRAAAMPANLPSNERSSSQSADPLLGAASTPGTARDDIPLEAVLRQAVEVYRGPFLEGVTFDDAPELDAWVRVQRTYWQSQIERVFDRLTQQALDGGAFGDASQFAERWGALSPASEAALRRQMQALAAAGERVAALAAYERWRRQQAQVLDIEPMPETVALAERLRATTRPGTHTIDARNDGGVAAYPTSTQSGQPTLLRLSQAIQAPLIGRAGEFETLVTAYEAARRGSPQVVVIDGEAGIGKTRLVAEFLQWAAVQGADVLRGKTYGAGGSLPYQPIVDAFRPRLARVHAPDDLLDDVWLAELVRLFPELHERYPDLPLPALALPSDEHAAYGRLFEAVVQLGLALATRGAGPLSRAMPSLALFLDDVQWSEPATLDLLQYGLRRWTEEGVALLVLLAVRAEDLAEAPATEQWLSALPRYVSVTRVSLGPLTAVESLWLVVAACGGEEDSGAGTGVDEARGADEPLRSTHNPTAQLHHLADWLYAQTAGQPFYMLAMLRTLVEQHLLIATSTETGRLAYSPADGTMDALATGGSLPGSVREVLRTRVAGLRASASALLLAAAVLEQHATFERLFQVAGLSEREGMAALENVLRRRLLVEQSGTTARAASGHDAAVPRRGPGWVAAPTCRFSHDLLREFVYGEASQTQRTIYHRRALAALEQAGAPSPELAHHAVAGGLVEPAFRYSLAAGDAAFALYAIREALVHYERAWHLIVDQMRPAADAAASGVSTAGVAPATEDWERLCLQLGRAYESSRMLEQAQTVYRQMLRQARAHGAIATETAALNRLAWIALQLEGTTAAQAVSNDALALAEQTHDPSVTAETHLNAATIAAFTESHEAALRHASVSLEWARATDDPALVAQCVHTVGWAYSGNGQWSEAATTLREACDRYAALAEAGQPSDLAAAAQHAETEDLAKLKVWTQVKQLPILSYRTMEAFDLALLGAAETNRGAAQAGVAMGRRGWRLACDTHNLAAQPDCGAILTGCLIEIGAYEEALQVARAAVAAARALPALSKTHALLGLADALLTLFQLDEAAQMLAEAANVAEMHSPGQLHVRLHSRWCLYHVLTQNRPAAQEAARKATALRDAQAARLLAFDFYRYHETAALVRSGDVELARHDAQRLGERIERGAQYARFWLVHLRMRAMLARCENHPEQEVELLTEALSLAEALGLPGEQWRIQARLAAVYHERGGAGDAERAAGLQAMATSTVHTLADQIADATLRDEYHARTRQAVATMW